MGKEKVIVVGGGIAGLAAGIYARQSGFETEILEMHSIPGGNSTSWRRKGYLFEGGMHWLTGSDPKSPLNRVWRETGALQANNPIYNRDPFLTYIDEKGPICLYRDPERLRRHLLEVSPSDKKAIDRLVRDIRLFRKVSMPVTDLKGVKVRYKAAPPLKMLPALLRAIPRMKQLNQISAGEYLSQFSHPGLRTLLNTVVSRTDFTASSTIFTLGGLAAGDCGYPKDGSLRMAQNMADTFTGLGGRIRYNTRVEKVTVTNGRASGVIADGQPLTADAVIVTADTLAAIDRLFDEPLHEPWMDEMRAETTPLNCVFLSLGVRADLSDLPENLLLPVQGSPTGGQEGIRVLGLNHYANFEGYAPEGCTAVTIALSSDRDHYDEWKAAKEDGTYEAKKQQLAEAYIALLARAVPRTAGRVEVWDVATPLTYERYCGTWHGSWMSVMKPGFKRQQYPCRPETIDRLYFAGQRLTLPGGLPVAVTTGRTAVQQLCLDTDSVFQAHWSRPEPKAGSIPHKPLSPAAGFPEKLAIHREDDTL